MNGVEKYLDAMIDGTDVSKFNCKTRVEEYLKKCCMCEPCDDLEPHSRIEYLLKELSIKLKNDSEAVGIALSEDY